MDANVASAPVLEARLSPVWRVQLRAPDTMQAREPGPAPKVEPPAPVQLVAGDVQILIDKASGRFINTLVDPDTQEVLRQYPSEAQLAYSRAVRAYLSALTAA